MKRELEHFYIGYSYGGNQDWFRTFMMRIGGCGAETACDSSLYFAIHMGVEGIYPFDLQNLTKSDYVDFAHMMEKYLWPRMSGIDRLDIYVDGYSKYLSDRGVSCIAMDMLDGHESYGTAALTIKKQIDSGYPVPTLILNHKDKSLKDYVWHWFLINGYEEAGDTLMVKTVTYSSSQWLDLRKLWETGHSKRGGLILYRKMEANYKELEKNVCYVIKEQHLKLGFSENSRWLYYPLSSLNYILGTECDADEMVKTLEGFFEYAEDRLGKGKVTYKGERFCLHMDPKASVYVRDNVEDEPFLVDLIGVLEKHGTSMEEVVDVFRRYSDRVHAEEADNDEFDMMVYFEDGEPDPFVYCLADEMGHITYHRMTMPELKERLK